MTELNAALAGEFTFGSDLAVNRLGFGAMRLTGPGVWGEPPHRRGFCLVPGGCLSRRLTRYRP
jgi:hypothetical protein